MLERFPFMGLHDDGAEADANVNMMILDFEVV